LKILVITPHFEPDTAPTGVIVSALAKKWCEQGHEIHVITSLPWYAEQKLTENWRRSLIQRSRIGSIRITRVHPFPYKKSNIFLRTLSFISFSFFVAIVSILHIGRFDLVFTLSPPLTLGLSGKIASIRHRCPLIFNVQDIYPDVAIDTGVINSSIVIKVSKFFEKVIYRNSDAITVLSQDLKENVESKLQNQKKVSRIEVIPNFAYDHFFDSNEHGNYRRENELENKIVVMYAGNIGYSQPLELVVDVAKTHQQKADLVYVINGGGTQADLLRSEASDLDNMIFVDYQPYERLPEVLSSADIHLVILRAGLGKASVPSKIYNIFATGRPVIASVDPGTEIEKIVLESRAGIVVKPDDSSELKMAIETLIENPDLMKQMGNAAKEWANKWHTSESVSISYTKLMKDIITN
tara:strand:- start:3254 stop:4483 length:1230 start_codon:yes stop_codon:yes gene_type:complete